MKGIFTSLLSKLFQKIAANQFRLQNLDFEKNLNETLTFRNVANSSEIQASIRNQYLLMKEMLPKDKLPELKDTGFKVFSQYEEDGILLYIFTLIGTTNKKVVEICAADGKECMSTNLIVNHSWEGLLLDGDETNVESGKLFFKNFPMTSWVAPQFVKEWITVENINEILKKYGMSGEIDLLSLDIDGNDYWILKAITEVSPRVIICEVQDIIPAELSYTIPYSSNFYYKNLPEEQRDYRGASLLAMNKLLKSKNYRLIGAHHLGFNVFFMRNDIGNEFFKEVSVESVLNNRWSDYGRKSRWPEVQNMHWEEV